MKQNFTFNDLIRYIYKETTAVENQAIKEALEKDFILREEYENLFHSYLLLPKAKFSPPAVALKNILDYSEQTALNPML